MSHTPGPAVTAETITLGGAFQVHVKIATPDVELNVWIPDAEVARLHEVRTAPWPAKSVRIGEAAGAPAWWSVDGESRSCSILVGLDDEMWDVGVTLPLDTLDVILAEVAKCAGESWTDPK